MTSVTPLNGAFAPPKRVEAPIPTGYEYGLFSVAPPQPFASPEEANGIEFEPYGCAPPQGYVRACGDEANPPGKDTDRDEGDVNQGSPYTLIGKFSCATIGYPEDVAMGIARQELLNGEQQGTERELWSGELGSITSLAGGIGGSPGVGTNTEDLTPGGGPPGIIDGIAALEDWLGANYLGRGFIHAQRGMAAPIASARLLIDDGQRARTPLGTNLVFGAGYNGIGPDGDPPADGSAWLYATGLVVIRRGEIQSTPPTSQRGAAIDATTNELVALAERTYVNAIDGCGVAAIRVLIAGCC